MNQMSQFILLAGEGAPANPLYVIVLQLVLIGALMYFIIFRPQKKQQKQMDAMLSALKKGDSVLTSSGFYGVVIDIMEEVVIVEFGSNRNCRIPMKKDAIVALESEDAGKDE